MNQRGWSSIRNQRGWSSIRNQRGWSSIRNQRGWSSIRNQRGWSSIRPGVLVDIENAVHLWGCDIYIEIKERDRVKKSVVDSERRL
jgi:hypothetical protein